MPFAAFDAARLLIASSIILILSKINTSAITDGLLELFLVGRIPGTEHIIQLEAFFAGAIFVAWAIATQKFGALALQKIEQNIRNFTVSQAEIEEIAL